MRRSSRWPGSVGLVVLLLGSVAAAHAQSVEVGVNGTFSGSIVEAGVDTFGVEFYATEGSSIEIKCQVERGDSLQPIVVVRDQGAQEVSGSTQRIGWLPTGNFRHYVTVPADGWYVAVIGGSSGSGRFNGQVTGNAVPPDQTWTLSGVVTDADTEDPIAGATVSVDGAAFATTASNGSYSGMLASGTYDVTFEADGYDAVTTPVEVPGSDVTLNVSLAPFVAVTLSTSYDGDSNVGGAGTASVDVQTAAGVTVDSIQWTQVYGTLAELSNADTADAGVALGDLADYKDELIVVLSEPPISEEDLPPNVPLPEGEFPGGLQDRLQVLALNPFSLEETGLVRLEVEVTTSAGVFTEDLEIHSALPWKVSSGLRNVPIGIPVLLYAVTADAYDWTMTAMPAGSTATLTDATTQVPYFTPDVAGRYEFEVTDGMGGPESTLEVYAGTWRGIIVDQDAEGRPVPDPGCQTCHNPALEGDPFVPWTQTGHAEIFTDSLNTNSHYSSRCFSCHTVGYDPDVDNGGIDEQPDYQAFLDAGLLSNPSPDNWTTVLEQFPDTAKLSNIQCEQCHGPQNTAAHFGGAIGDPRASISSDVCATCHGEPLRHARFQQWQLSAHANYELAVDEGDSGNCSRCHTGNGFLAWFPVLNEEVPGDPLDNVDVTWELDEVHPQTCITCHDPHMVGTSSGNDPDVNIRISGDTPPLIAGFTATNVGTGAMCMTCHNSRRGLRNDDIWDTLSASEKARAPHGSSQADMLMGQNAYLVEVDAPGGHAMTENTCVDCHMKATPPPDVLSYNQGGANHTFYAELDICSECHSPYMLASDVQNGVNNLLEQVYGLITDAYYDAMSDLIDAGNTIDLNGDATVTDMAAVAEVLFGETRGRQAVGVEFDDGTVSGPHRVPDIDVIDGGGNVIGTLNEFVDEDVLKAGWNWNLVNNDGSIGLHNPFFANGTLTAARDAVVALSSAGGAGTFRELRTTAEERPTDATFPLLRSTTSRQRKR